MLIRDKLNKIIFESDTKSGKLFDLILLWSILVSVILFGTIMYVVEGGEK